MARSFSEREKENIKKSLQDACKELLINNF